jgi:hypothetical protein
VIINKKYNLHRLFHPTVFKLGKGIASIYLGILNNYLLMEPCYLGFYTL